MGSDVHGTLAFGIPASEELPLRLILHGAVKNASGDWELKREDDDGPDEETRYFIAKSGKNEPDYDSDKANWSKWLQEKRDFMKSHPVKTVLSGVDDYLEYNIAIKESVYDSEWGETVAVKSLEIKPGWVDAIKDYCETLGVPYQEPFWFLTSRYF